MQDNKLKPISILGAIAIFGIPGIAIYTGTHYLVPALIDSGIPLIASWTLCVVGPTFMSAICILLHYFRTEKPNSIEEFKIRFRLNKPCFGSFLLLIPVTFSIIVLNELLSPSISYLENIKILSPQPIRPELFDNPYEKTSNPLEMKTFFGVVMSGATWWLIPFWLIWVIVGVFSEELVWRGYLLPRMELSFGRWSWFINGLLWNLPFHLYTISNSLADLPFNLILPFIVYKYKNTWLGVGIHSLLVSLAYVIIIPGVLK